MLKKKGLAYPNSSIMISTHITDGIKESHHQLLTLPAANMVIRDPIINDVCINSNEITFSNFKPFLLSEKFKIRNFKFNNPNILSVAMNRNSKHFFSNFWP